jgi:hypothetical protein
LYSSRHVCNYITPSPVCQLFRSLPIGSLDERSALGQGKATVTGQSANSGRCARERRIDIGFETQAADGVQAFIG